VDLLTIDSNYRIIVDAVVFRLQMDYVNYLIFIIYLTLLQSLQSEGIAERVVSTTFHRM